LHGKVSTTLSRAVKMRFHTASVDNGRRQVSPGRD
jgi:hypothetical protein